VTGRAAAALALGLAALAAACQTKVVVSQPTLERELAAALEARRLDGAVDRVLRWIEGPAAEAADRGRLDRVERAAAARAGIAALRRDLDDLHRQRLDREGKVDADLARFLLDRAEAAVALADADEPLVAGLAYPAGDALAAAPGPIPAPADLLRLADPALLLPPPDGRDSPRPRTAADLRAALSRLRQAAERLRRAGDAAAVLHGADGAAARAGARAAADRAEARAARLEEEAKALDGAADAFPPPAGRERFASLLRTRHGLDAPPEEVEAFGTALLAETTRDLETLAAAHFPGRTWKEALEEVRKDHASAAELPGEALRDALAARDFCIERGLVTIPEEARLGHVELVGEEMSRTYPFAAYSWRLPTPEGESGRYMVSAGATWMDPAQAAERLRGNCRAWTRVVAPHETWPGHHLQIWYADRFASRLRRAAGTSTLVEGWGLYSEWLLERHGFFTAPGERLALLAMRAWRACRVVLDVRLHRDALPPEEAIAFLVEHAGLTRDAAASEVRRYLGDPTQPFSYAWGWREILALRAAEEARLGPAFSEREFHDRLLRAGPIPFPFLRRLFGDRRTEPDP
jgi:uncharacterized protein (DUF885 family)